MLRAHFPRSFLNLSSYRADALREGGFTKAHEDSRKSLVAPSHDAHRSVGPALASVATSEITTAKLLLIVILRRSGDSVFQLIELTYGYDRTPAPHFHEDCRVTVIPPILARCLIVPKSIGRKGQREMGLYFRPESFEMDRRSHVLGCPHEKQAPISVQRSPGRENSALQPNSTAIVA
jgi:hypothetical protein